MFGRSKREVLVVGAGPVGLFSALHLHRAGLRPHIIDHAERTADRSYALALHPASLELMTDVGLAAELLERARRVDKIGLYDGNERRGEIDLTSLPTKFPYVAILPQSALEEMLIEALHRAGIRVQSNHRLVHLEMEGKHVSATVDTLDREPMGYATSEIGTVVRATHDLRVAFVVGADGYDSQVRRQLGIGFDPVSPSEQFAVFEFTPEADLPEEIRIVLDEHSTNVLWPMPDGRYRWSFQIPEGEPGGLAYGEAVAAHASFPTVEMDRLEAWMRDRAPWFPDRIREDHWRIAVRFEHRLATSFGRGRVWLAGDAGHLAGPVGVHSMNVGFREAARLGELFAGVVRDEASLEALERYDDERRTEWRALLGLMPRAGQAAHASPWVAARADRLPRCMPVSGRHLDHALAQLGLAPPAKAA